MELVGQVVRENLANFHLPMVLAHLHSILVEEGKMEIMRTLEMQKVVMVVVQHIQLVVMVVTMELVDPVAVAVVPVEFLYLIV